MNTHVPEEYGGPGLDYLDGCLIEEEFGWGCSGIGTSLDGQRPRLRADHPRRLRGDRRRSTSACSAEEPKLASFCLTEPDAGSDVSGMSTTAVQEGRQVRHQRLQVLHHQRRLRRLVHGLRQDRPGGRPPRDLAPSSSTPTSPGSAVDKKEDKMGQRASNTATISFDEVEIPAENLLGEENKGFKLAMMTLDRTRPGVAAMAVGIARAALRVRHRVLEGARAVRRADRDAPGDPVHDRRHGDQGRGRAACWSGTPRSCSTRASATRSALRMPSASPPTRRWRSRSTPCRSTAATASSRSTRSRS